MLGFHPFLWPYPGGITFTLTAFTTLGLTSDVPVAEEHGTILTDETLHWVVAVLDGDTLLVSSVSNREIFQVRLLAVDTNEINGPDSTAECYGAEATIFSMNFLEDRVVRLIADPANEDEDSYGRKLRYVDVPQEDGTFTRLNDALLFEGYATFPDKYPVTDPDYFKALEVQAKAQEKGLWGACYGRGERT